MSRHLSSPDQARRLFRQRRNALALVLLVIVGFLTYNLIHLQVHEHTRYETLSTNNYVSLKPLVPTRGLIFDRELRLLADNQPTFDVTVVPEKLPGPVDGLLTSLRQRMTLTEADEVAFRRHWSRARRFEAVPVRLNVSEEELARLSVEQYALDGVSLTASLARRYTHPEAFAHVLGYVGRINEEELRQQPQYLGSDVIGKTGIEFQYEAILRGQMGFAQVENNVHGRPVRERPHTPMAPGDDLILTVMAPLQVQITEWMRGKRGAVVALDPRNGDVLAMVSSPSFDPNALIQGVSAAEYRAWQSRADRPLFHRALQGQYPPASTLKPFVALAALESGTVDSARTIHDPGYFQLSEDSRAYKDWKTGGHGAINLVQAIAESCDTYFYVAANEMGIEPMAETLKSVGLGQPTGIDLPNEGGGLVPDPRWKRRSKGEGWYPGETLITAIGQGFMLATPLQLAEATAVIANRGQVFQPRLVKGLRNSEGEIQWVAPRLKGTYQLEEPKHWSIIIEGMEKTIRHPRGTAHRFYDPKRYRFAGKTGTAQVYSLKEGEVYDKHTVEAHLRDHTLFIAFAPIEAPEIALAVVLENESGSSRLAKKVLDAYFAHTRDAS